MNSPQIAANLIGPGVNPGVSPTGGTGLMVRICTEKFNAGRTKAWLDLSNSGKWATASAGGKDVLETSVKMFVPSGQAVTSTFGIMIARSSFETGGGFVVSAQTGAVSLLSGGYAVSNRTATDATVAAPSTGNAFAFFKDIALLALPTATPCPADISGDGQVDGTDLASVLGSWGGLGGDLDGNGVTDGADLSIVLGSWGPCP